MAIKPTEDLLNVIVDGVAIKAPKGAMIIHVTDVQGAYVPRFCYHDKLPIAANCRMCLVEVENAPKPLPACATPIAEGMKIFTKSKLALGAQKATMEFLLINHPLDCPICDQGGECELQDLALGFGRDIARFNERKRVVKDKNLGPLVSTDMTRCIHCTRCVRFGQDVAGIQELGTTGRGENMEIGTYIEASVDHELSGNIIDLCPVGALNSKPFRFQGRSWEMTQVPLVATHDGLGSNVYGHVLRGELKRVVPRVNDDINETWISDRDRFSYTGLYASDRLQKPMIREGSQWREASWEDALQVAVHGLKGTGTSLGVLAHPSCTTEEFYLAARVARALGSNNIDHRLRVRDFRDANADPLYPSLGLPLAEVDALTGVLVIGSNLRSELPLLAHRLRKAAVGSGAQVAFFDSTEREYLFPVAAQFIAGAGAWCAELSGVLAAAYDLVGVTPAPNLSKCVKVVRVTATHLALAKALCSGANRAVWLGALAMRHPAYADLRVIAAELARVVGANLGLLAEGGNAAGAWLAGAVPHRGAVAAALSGAVGLNTYEMLHQAQRSYLCVGAIEPATDIAEIGLAHAAFKQADCVVVLTPFVTDELRQYAHVLLPIATCFESSGTYVNLEGRWQSQSCAARAVGEARPGWKVLRVLGNLLALEGFDYQSSEEIREELRSLLGVISNEAVQLSVISTHVPVEGTTNALFNQQRDDVPMYAIDALLRRAGPLQNTAISRRDQALHRVSGVHD